jgi:transposase
MVLLAHQGLSNDQIAERLSTRREIVSMWQMLLFEGRWGGREPPPRPGRPRVFPPRTGRAG